MQISSFCLCSEFWLGLERMHRYTITGTWQLQIQVTYDKLTNGRQSKRGGVGISVYSNFTVGPEPWFRLGIEKRTYQKDMPADPMQRNIQSPFRYAFSAPDRDVDGTSYPCSRWTGGGWWLNKCYLYYLCGNCLKDEAMKHRVAMRGNVIMGSELLSKMKMWMRRVG